MVAPGFHSALSSATGWSRETVQLRGVLRKQRATRLTSGCVLQRCVANLPGSMMETVRSQRGEGTQDTCAKIAWHMPLHDVRRRLRCCPFGHSRADCILRQRGTVIDARCSRQKPAPRPYCNGHIASGLVAWIYTCSIAPDCGTLRRGCLGPCDEALGPLDTSASHSDDLI